MIFRHSQAAIALLKGLKGVEIGGSAHNPFGLNTINVDFTDSLDTVYKKEEVAMAGHALPVDVVADGSKLPFEKESFDFIINSHVFEHIWDPIGTLIHWMDIIKVGGYIFMIIPDKRKMFDSERERTTLKELIIRHQHPEFYGNPDHLHCNVWILEDVLQLCAYMGLDVVYSSPIDDKVGNGFTVCIMKQEVKEEAVYNNYAGDRNGTV